MHIPGWPACALAITAGFALTACTVGPDYVRPAVDVPAAWRIDYPKAAEVADTQWWKQFGDPVLDDLIDATLRENRDIRIAVARVEQAMGGLMATRSQLFPQLGYGADATRTRQSRVGTTPIPEPFSPYFSVYQGSVAAQWQLDLFGRVQRLSEAAQAQVYATEQAKRGVVLTLVAGVSTSYIALRALDRQLAIAQSTAANFEETRRIFDLRYRKGLVSMTEVSQITSQYQQALAAIPLFRQAIAAQENAISVLTGRNPGPVPRGKTIEALAAPVIPADLPSTVLLRRPDILQAEQNLIAANANIGAAKALYFPSISLTGLLGSVSTAFGNFLTGPASTWALVAGVTGPIFTFGGIEGQVRIAEGSERAALAFYQQTILGALRETNDALTGSQEKIDELAMQTLRVQALREFARLSQLRFDKGIANYVEVLVAENELFAAELANARVQGERYAQVVAVYQAMGGGWVDFANAATPQPAGVATILGR
jgi:multidrug efflux system outer membrane protein